MLKIGDTLNRWTIVSFVGTRPRGPKSDYTYRIWKCKCSCGNEKEVLEPTLLNGRSKSCGCYGKQQWKVINKKHGETSDKKPSVEYRTWTAMLTRCRNINCNNYKDYGARGISVCESWNKFENFLQDMGRRPSNNHSLNKIDNNGMYCKENCEWALFPIQAANKRNTRYVTYNGKEIAVCLLAREYNISNQLLSARLKRGWSIHEALHQPTQKRD